ncbi:kinase-like domain-containing protein [Mycena leptocephala]|nr:kinase-like domain-containing protein [Mycena leptocephala]
MHPYVASLSREFQTWVKGSKSANSIAAIVASVNVGALKDQAAEVMGQGCTECTPIAQGGSNTVFVLTFEDGRDIVARVAISAYRDKAGHPEELVADSVVATLSYVAKHTSIPVPKVYYFNRDPGNPVGATYILMSRIAGRPLGPWWDDADSEGRRQIVEQLALMEAELLLLRFSAIGCLIDANPTVGALGPSATYPFDLRHPHRGPFPSSKHFLLAHIRSELDFLADLEEWTVERRKWSAHNGGGWKIFHAHAIQWFGLLCDAVVALPAGEFDPEHFALFHDDFDMGNILVSDEGKVVGIVDWEGSRVCPLWNDQRYSTFLRDLNRHNDAEELASLQQLQGDLIRSKTGKEYPGSSRLRLESLLYIVDYKHSARSTRAYLDGLFLTWFQFVERTAGHLDLSRFLALRHFIEDH